MKKLLPIPPGSEAVFAQAARLVSYDAILAWIGSFFENVIAKCSGLKNDEMADWQTLHVRRTIERSISSACDLLGFSLIYFCGDGKALPPQSSLLFVQEYSVSSPRLVVDFSQARVAY